MVPNLEQRKCNVLDTPLLTETYHISIPFEELPEELPFPIGLVSLCNDAVRKEKVKSQGFYKELPEKKRYPTYPAVKISRLGIHKDFQGYHIGTYIINLIKKMFVTNNRTGCRLITVDAYNHENVLKFYKSNDFQCFSFKEKDLKRSTRAMFFDLKRLTGLI